MNRNDEIQLGVLVIGRKRPGFDQEWNQVIRRRCDQAFRALHFSCIGGDTPVVDDETIIAALKELTDDGAEALVVLQPSLGNGQLALTVAQHWAGPIVLWATPERPDGEKVSSCSLVAQHLWASILRQANHAFELVYGDPDAADVRQLLRRAVLLARTVKRLKHSKLGVIGSHAPGFIPMAADSFLMRRQIGVQLHDLSLPQFIDRVRGIDETQVARDLDRVKAMKMPMVAGVSADDLPMQSRYYLALREVMREERLDLLTFQCWPELPNVLGQWPYLAVTRLASEDVSLAIEGDADGAISLFIGHQIGAGAGFLTDWLEHDADTIHLWHPGMAPLGLCESPGTMSKHFNIEKPFVVDAPLRTDRAVTIARLWHCDGEYRMMAFEGRTIPRRRELTGNTALVQVADCDVSRLFDDLCHAGLPHHVILFDGAHAEALRRLARMMRIAWVG